jgi:hypothetical protein
LNASNRPNPRDKLIEFLDGRPCPPETDDELRDDVQDYFRQKRGRTAGRRDAEAEDVLDWLSDQLPAGLQERQQRWTKARLERQRSAVSGERADLHCDAPPYPGGAALVREAWDWVNGILRRQLPRGIGRSRTPSAEVKGVILLLTKRDVGHPVLDRTGDDFIDALRAFVATAEFIARDVCCSPLGAAIWILADIEPSSTCCEVEFRQGFSDPDAVRFSLNPEVVTPEELRTIYRGVRRKLKQSTQRRFSEFDGPLSDHGGEPDRERFEHWNERYPLNRYKNVRSFRVAAHRHRKRRERMPGLGAGSGNATRPDKPHQTPIASATFPHESSASPSRRRR